MKLLRIVSVALLALASLGASPQAYPGKVVRIIEPAGPGSAVDVFARWGQAVVIDNKPGANSALGAREAARAAPDGHTLFHANINNSLNDVLTMRASWGTSWAGPARTNSPRTSARKSASGVIRDAKIKAQ